MDTDVEIDPGSEGCGTGTEYRTEPGTKEPSGPLLDEAAQTLAGLYGARLNDLTVERLVVGIFFVGIKFSDGSGGIAYNPPRVARAAGNRILKGRSAFVRGMTAADVIRGHMENPFAGVIRLAALNALSQPFFDRGRYVVDTSGDISGVPALFRHRRICMVGAIIPLLKRLKALDTRGTVIIDRKEATQDEAEAGYGTFVRPERTAESLAACDTAVFTGAAVANGSIQGLIDLVPGTAAIVVVGPTAGFVPEPLFRRNVAMVGTSAVTDSDTALDILAEGGGGYRLFGRCARKINLLNTERMLDLGLAGLPADINAIKTSDNASTL